MTLNGDFDPEDDFEEEDEEEPDIFDNYEALKEEVPPREVDFSQFAPVKSMTEEEEEGAHRSDLQEAMFRLLPRYGDKELDEILRPLHVARISPENYIDLNYLIVASYLEEHAEDANVNFAKVVTAVQTATSIGNQGMGRIDVLEIAGVAHEEKLDQISKELGIG